MSYAYVARGVDVDAGIILVADRDYWVSKCPPGGEIEGIQFTVPRGRYGLRWRIRKTWNGNVKGSGTLVVSSGVVVVADPCYSIPDRSQPQDDRWLAWLESVKRGRKPDAGTLILDKMGGDGGYDVELELTPLETRH